MDELRRRKLEALNKKLGKPSASPATQKDEDQLVSDETKEAAKAASLAAAKIAKDGFSLFKKAAEKATEATKEALTKKPLPVEEPIPEEPQNITEEVVGVVEEIPEVVVTEEPLEALLVIEEIQVEAAAIEEPTLEEPAIEAVASIAVQEVVVEEPVVDLETAQVIEEPETNVEPITAAVVVQEATAPVQSAKRSSLSPTMLASSAVGLVLVALVALVAWFFGFRESEEVKPVEPAQVVTPVIEEPKHVIKEKAQVAEPIEEPKPLQVEPVVPEKTDPVEVEQVKEEPKPAIKPSTTKAPPEAKPKPKVKPDEPKEDWRDKANSDIDNWLKNT